TDSSKTELLATSFVSYGETGPKGADGAPGTSAKDFSIIATSPTFSLSSRGTTLSEQAVILSCSLLNIAPSEVTVQWAVSQGASLIVQQGLETTLIIPAASQADSVQVTCTVTGNGSKSLVLKGVKSGAEAPVYLGVLAAAEPSIAEHFAKAEGRFIKGDFFLYSTSAGHFPKWYNGASWAAVDADTPNYSQICADTLADSLRQPGTMASSSAIFGFFRTLVANDAFITEFGSQLIRILKDGMICTDDFAADPATGRPASGFCLDNPVVDPQTGERRGRIRAGNAMFVDSTLHGRIIHDLLTTQEASPAPKVTMPDPGRWNTDSLIGALSGLPNDTPLAAAGSYEGHTLQGLLKKTSEEPLTLFSSVSGYTVPQSFTVPYTGRMQLGCSGGYTPGGPNSFVLDACSIKLNGALVLQTGSYGAQASAVVDVCKGDVITAFGKRTVNNFPPGSYNFIESDYFFEDEQVRLGFVGPAGLYLQYLDAYHPVKPGRFSDKGLGIDSPVSWSSSDHLLYSSGALVISQCTALSKGVSLSATGSVVIDGVGRSINSVFYTGGSLTLLYTGGAKELVIDNSDMALTGWYAISGSFTPDASAAAVIVRDIYPRQDAACHLGSADRRFKSVYANTFNAASLRKWKKHILPFCSSALGILRQVQVVSFQYKDECGTHLHTGFIADDAPQCLTGADHDTMALADTVGMLIRAVQELDARISQLEES
ncbi:MAG: tail fiber domain-containing protein, partial [Chloroflexia bacterium]|nr:tail fiber domain-containing protein [Chloroflexia bacterium]